MSVLRLALMIMGILSEMNERVNIFSVYDIWQKYSSLWEKGFFNLFFYTGNLIVCVKKTWQKSITEVFRRNRIYFGRIFNFSDCHMHPAFIWGSNWGKSEVAKKAVTMPPLML